MMKRLAFVQMLFLQGVEQSRLPEPLNVTSVLTLHDASELFLGMAAEKLGARLSRRGQTRLHNHPPELRNRAGQLCVSEQPRSQHGTSRAESAGGNHAAVLPSRT